MGKKTVKPPSMADEAQTAIIGHAQTVAIALLDNLDFVVCYDVIGISFQESVRLQSLFDVAVPVQAVDAWVTTYKKLTPLEFA